LKIALILLVVLTAGLFGVAILAGPQLREAMSGFAPEPDSTEVRAESVMPGQLVESVQAPGRIEPHTSVDISAEVSARIIDLPVEDGQEVRKGDLVCKLDDRDLKAALVSANARRDGETFRLRSDQSRLDGLRQNVAFARAELVRMQTLYETGDISRRDLDNILERVQDLETSIEATNFSLSVVESSLAVAAADIEQAEDGLQNTVILAPMDGRVTVLNVEEGEIVTGSTTNPGTVIMSIADLSRMVLKAEVAESDIARVNVGQRAKLHINAYPDEIFSGTVRQIAWQRTGSPDGTGYFETEIEIDLQGRRIRSGHRANADIEIESHEGLVVPRQAIVVRETEELPEAVRSSPLVDLTKTKCNVVYRIVEEKTVCTPVRPGASDLTHRLVLDGLSEGDVILTGPYKVLETIKDDEFVKQIAAAEATGAEPVDATTPATDTTTEADADADAGAPDPDAG